MIQLMTKYGIVYQTELLWYFRFGSVHHCRYFVNNSSGKHIIYCSIFFFIFSPLCLVLHSFSALQNQPLLILNMYDFGDVKGIQPFDLTLHTVDSKITRLLDDPRFRQVECVQFTFLSPHPIISFL